MPVGVANGLLGGVSSVGVVNGLLRGVSVVGVANRGRSAIVLCGGDPEASWRLLEGHYE